MTRITKADRAGKTPAYIRDLASKEYSREASADADAVTRGLLPAGAKTRIADKTGLPKSRLASLVDPVYFRENGLRNPLPLGEKRTPAALTSAVVRRRDAGGTLGRWESVAAAASAALGRPVSEAAVRALYAKKRDPETSYTGRGTRIAAPKTREDETVEVIGAATTDAPE